MCRGRRARGGLRGLSGELAHVLGEAVFLELVGLARLRNAWVEIVGPMMAARSEPLYFETSKKGRCLWVGVDHSMLAQQIRFLRDEIRKACFRHTGIGKLTHIRTRVMPGVGIKREARKPAARQIPCAQKRALARELGVIKDRRLRRAVFRARLAQWRYMDASEIASVQTRLP